VRCPRCGNENSEQNRFCGMCGASLLATPAPKAAEPQAVPVAASPTAAGVVAEPAHDRPRPVVESSSSISGPSFLGLNDPGPNQGAPRKRASLSIDPHSAPGSNLDYLLDEEEPQHHWGIGKFLLILIALALAVGFGYLRFKDQGLAWLSGLKKPAVVAQDSTTPDTTAPPASSPSITPDPQPPVQPAAAAPQPTTAVPANAPSGNAAASPAPATASPDTSAPADTSKPPDTSKPAETAPPVANTDKAASPTEKDSSTAEESTDAPAPATKPAEKPKPAPKAPAAKPSAAARPATAYDPVSEAQKYLYGRGAAQDCDRGLRLLRPAANQANPKAMIEMGALYSAGLCAPRDLPTAYRWFALALRKDPENTAVQTDLQKLWGEMTQPERQLAIKLTQ
jgi:hypothetical protein